VPEQQENSAKNGEQTNAGNNEEIVIERAIFEVIEQTDCACEDEQATEHDDRHRALHGVKARILRGDDAVFNVFG
jgi:hypothetical protein